MLVLCKADISESLLACLDYTPEKVLAANSSFLGTEARDLQCSLVRTQNQLVQARGGTGAWAKGNRTCTRQGRAHEGDSDEEEEEGVNSVTAKLSR